MSGSIIGTVRCVECGQKLSYSATPGEIAVTPCKVCVGTAEKEATPSNPDEFRELAQRLDAQAWQRMLEYPLKVWLDDGSNKRAIRKAMELVKLWGGGTDMFDHQYKIEPAPTGAAPTVSGVELHRDGWFVSERLRFGGGVGPMEHEVLLLPKKGTHWRLRRFEERDGGK